VTFGFGNFRKSDSFQLEEVVDNDSSVGLSLGAGLEFVISPRTSYFYLAAKAYFVNFADTNTTVYQAEGIPNLSGNFYTFTSGVMFTW
jgi:hypothetical protein